MLDGDYLDAFPGDVEIVLKRLDPAIPHWYKLVVNGEPSARIVNSTIDNIFAAVETELKIRANRPASFPEGP